MLSFSQLNSNNFAGAFELQCACHAYPWSRSTFASCLDGQYFAWQMLENRQLAGFYVGLQVLDEGTLMDIGLGPHFRNKGLSRPLLEHFLQQCKKKGIQDIWLEVRASNKPAIHLYKQYGFNLIETRKGYYPSPDGREDAMIMKLSP
ncbi:ribosomal protein S18-alanine N-acetyltransferase [Aliiglaciecola sp. CAU 1673]|uniref:ribosomal protein S18-alanine N-acetyltransferase n=1 Tax=Aliiglaciecola sp. CAU 1673 TaxID=3032595 RepID=UPI0023DC8228|nr:ribosomal protein S18-alanine N-acetyltransferase [Aliiglaciecola sp. CAU 1673]MDF2180076.1 ribosomal protein S18-alanine N-acetyltransferase [Aliiglaciecola sp. CAU 1673]